MILTGWFLLCALAFGGCGTDRENDPTNPSYRVVTAQVEAIESAMGLQGGLGVLLRQAGGHGEGPPWFVISQKTAAIEQTWSEIRAELDRRATVWADVPGVAISFENALEALWADISAKEPLKASTSLARLNSSFGEVKSVLKRADVNSGRLTGMAFGIVAAVVGLTVASRIVTNWRDPRFMLEEWRANTGRQSEGETS